MQKLIEVVEKLKKSEVYDVVENRMKEFEEVGKSGLNRIFDELCFCLMTANFSAKGGIKIQENIGTGFHYLNEVDLVAKLREIGHRFPNARSKYVVLARESKGELGRILKEIKNEFEIREWVVKNIKGLGMKEVSHFLRNIGYKDLAIIDFHIVDLLVKYGLVENPKNKSMTLKKYIEIENILRKLSKQTNTNLGELDLYLWFEETGTVLK